MKTVAKGALRPKSPFRGKLDLFYEAEIAYTPGRSSDLHTLRETETLQVREGIQKHYPRFLAATYFVKLLELTAERETPVPELHELLSKALDYLNTSDPRLKAITRFELRLAEFLGLRADGPTGAIHSLLQAYHPVLEQRKELVTACGETAG